HAENAHALGDPELEHALQLRPERLPVVALEPERIDVLVLLRRVLGILHRAVGALQEPLRMLPDVRVIGRALEGDIQRDLQAQSAGAGEQSAEVFESAEARMHGLVSALTAADRPWASRVAGGGADAGVGALALDLAERMDRRQVQHVETHRGDVGQQSLEVREGTVLAGPGRSGTRKHLVPAGEARAPPFYLDGERRLVPQDELRIRAAPGELVQRIALREQRP